MRGNKRQAITMILGFLTMLVSALYVFFWNFSIYTAYTGSSVYRLLYIIGIRQVTPAGLMAHCFLIVTAALTILGIKYFFDAARSAEYQRLISGGYAFLAVVSFLYLIGMYLGTFIFSRDYFTKKANSAHFMMGAFILLIIFALYKCLLAKEKARSPMVIILIAATVLSFLAGGITRDDAYWPLVQDIWSYARNHDFLMNIFKTLSINQDVLSKLISIGVGILQTMPFFFLLFFELVYLPDRIKRPERYEGFIRESDVEEEGADEVDEEMEQTIKEVGKEAPHKEKEEEESDPDDLEDISDIIGGKYKL